MHIHSKPIFLITVFFLSFMLGGQAQNTDIARPGPKGVYLFLGKNIPCGKPTAAYRIERLEAKGDWVALSEVKTPLVLDELISKIELAKGPLPSQPLPAKPKLQQLFEKAIRTGTSDSLKGFTLNFPVKMGLGLMYYDAKAPTGQNIQYRITELSSAGDVIKLQISDTLTLPYTAVFDEVVMAESSRTKNSIYIKWRSTGKKPGPLFMVHRIDNKKPVAAGGTVAHYSVNDTTYYVYQDSLTAGQASQELQYFITPFDQLGNAGKSSQVVVVTNDNFSKSFFIKTGVSKIADKIAFRLSWHFSDPVTAKSVSLYRSEYREKGFELLSTFTSKDTSYTDETIHPEKSYYYYLQATSKSGIRFKQSEKIFALAYHPVKPISPVILEAIGTNQGVRLLIDVSDARCEGIRVFRNNGINDHLMSVSNLVKKADSSHIVYVDSSPDLSGRHNYTYAVRCESTGNVASDLSNKMSARPLMITAPSKPGFLKAFIENGNVRLFWEDMKLGDPGIAGYIVSRRIERTSIIANMPFSPVVGENQPYVLNSFIDSTVKSNNIYTYTIQAIDSEKIKSSQKAIVRISLNQEMPIAPCGLALRDAPEGVQIEWGQVQYPGMNSYRVYRYQPGQKPELLITLPSSATEFIDISVKTGVQYYYFLTSLTQKGKESAHSEEAAISR
jgi:fibronectin type 3 domain-containing protein